MRRTHTVRTKDLYRLYDSPLMHFLGSATWVELGNFLDAQRSRSIHTKIITYFKVWLQTSNFLLTYLVKMKQLSVIVYVPLSIYEMECLPKYTQDFTSNCYWTDIPPSGLVLNPLEHF